MYQNCMRGPIVCQLSVGRKKKKHNFKVFYYYFFFIIFFLRCWYTYLAKDLCQTWSLLELISAETSIYAAKKLQMCVLVAIL